MKKCVIGYFNKKGGFYLNTSLILKEEIEGLKRYYKCNVSQEELLISKDVDVYCLGIFDDITGLFDNNKEYLFSISDFIDYSKLAEDKEIKEDVEVK